MHFDEQVLAGPRRRRSYTKQYKAELAAQCLQPHVSIALANGLNANLLRRWVEEYKRSRADEMSQGSLRTAA
ncbi:transposase [Kerstersia gyiorum]|uniref:transposase n=1 Tax=Kerstersia gyiorum TaxID=206506 RepID=UPI003B43AD98